MSAFRRAQPFPTRPNRWRTTESSVFQFGFVVQVSGYLVPCSQVLAFAHADLPCPIDLSPSFTPAVRDVGAVISLFVPGRATPAAVTVCALRVGKPALLPIAQALPTAPRGCGLTWWLILGRIVVETGSDPAPLLSLLAGWGPENGACGGGGARQSLRQNSPLWKAELIAAVAELDIVGRSACACRNAGTKNRWARVACALGFGRQSRVPCWR